MFSLRETLSEQGFSEPEPAQGRRSVADLYKPGKRCGVYVLLFRDGSGYVGQSVDVVRRYSQHIRNHEDIEAISFRTTSPEELDLIEQGLVGVFEHGGYKLRNIVFSTLPPITSDFDLIMAEADQTRFLSDMKFTDYHGERIVNPELRAKYANKYRTFKEFTGISDVVDTLRLYVRVGIPAILKGEVSFWAVSCLPSYNNPSITLFLRVNVFWQEVFTMFREKQSGADFASLHVARVPIERDVRLLSDFANLKILDHTYVPGGHDQVNLLIPSRDLSAFMGRDSVRLAVRTFNLRLMKKGPCNFARNHCLDLADEIILG